MAELGFNRCFKVEGNYTAILTAGYSPSGSGQGVSISQTGLIPVSATSLFFQASGSGGNFQVFLGGQSLSFVPLSTASNYTLYGADISAFAGLASTLTFSVSTIGTGFGYEALDAIQFSSSPVPEPSTLVLAGLGGLLLGCRRWKNALS